MKNLYKIIMLFSFVIALSACGSNDGSSRTIMSPPVTITLSPPPPDTPPPPSLSFSDLSSITPAQRLDVLTADGNTDNGSITQSTVVAIQ